MYIMFISNVYSYLLDGLDPESTIIPVTSSLQSQDSFAKYKF